MAGARGRFTSGPPARGRIAGLIVLAGAVAGLGACSAASGAGPGPGNEQRYVEAGAATTFVPADQRKPAPNLSGPAIEGGDFDLAAQRGKVVVINVWGSWCPPCRIEAPALEQVWRQTRADGTQFVGLDTRDNEAAAKAYLRRFEITYPNLTDDDGQLQLLFRDSLPIAPTLPSTLFIDRQGRAAARITGPVDRAQLREVISQLLAEGPA